MTIEKFRVAYHSDSHVRAVAEAHGLRAVFYSDEVIFEYPCPGRIVGSCLRSRNNLFRGAYILDFLTRWLDDTFINAELMTEVF